MLKKTLIFAAALSSTLAGNLALARDQISIVGSSTVYPFTTVVAERFGKSGDNKTPKVESTGSGGGIKLFCSGVGVDTPDITNSSRRIKKSEFETCQKNGVTSVVEVKIGYDGIAIANAKSAPDYHLELRDVFLALAKDVPAKDGSETLVPNFYKTWNEVNAKLPNAVIKVLGPPPTSGTRDAFAELALEGGCKTYSWIKDMEKADKKKFESVCRGVREDGVYIEAGENDNLIVQKLVSDPTALGVFGYSFLDENKEKVKGATVGGIAPKFDAIADGSYPVSRPLYFYVKKANLELVPGIKDFVMAFADKKAIGSDGYLVERGLIPMPKAEFKQFAKAAKELTELTVEDLK